MSNKILITGGTGFLGSYIIKELVDKGFPVTAIRRTTSKLPAYISSKILDQVTWVEGDVLDPVALEDAMNDIDTVIHAAAIVSFSKRDQKDMYHVNIEGTANVVNAALAQNVKRFVHISSVAALGRTANGGEVNEEKKWEESKVNTHYAKSKYKAEIEVWRAISEGLNGIIVNPSTILGYGDWDHGSSAIFKRVHDGFKWYTDGINGFVDVEDVARATVLLMQTGITEERFLINGDNWSFKKLMDAIAENFAVKKPSRQATRRLLNMAGFIEAIRSKLQGTHPLVTKESIRVALSKTLFSNNKVLNTLKDFHFTPLEDTISKACALYSRQRVKL